MCYNSSSRLDEFMAGFNAISLKLKEMYQVCEPCFLLFKVFPPFIGLLPGENDWNKNYSSNNQK